MRYYGDGQRDICKVSNSLSGHRLPPKPFPPQHQIRSHPEPWPQPHHRYRHAPVAQDSRSLRGPTTKHTTSRSPTPLEDDYINRRTPVYEPPKLKLEEFTNIVNYGDGRELANVVKQQRLEMQTLLERDAEREARMKQLHGDAQRRLSKLRSMNKHLKSEAERAKVERLESLKSLESRSDRQLSKAEAIARFYASLRSMPLGQGSRNFIIKTTSETLPGMVGADRVSLYILDPPIKLQNSVDNNGSFVDDKVDPNTRIWTIQSVPGAGGEGDMITAPILQGGIVGESAVSGEVMDIEAGEKVDLARTRGLRDTLREVGGGDLNLSLNQSFLNQTLPNNSMDSTTQFTSGMLCVPVISPSSPLVLGVIQAMGPRQGGEVVRRFGEDGRMAVEGVAREVGVILENLGGKEEVHRVNAVSSILEHLWPTSSLDSVLDQENETAMKTLASDVSSLCSTFYENYSSVHSELFTLPIDSGSTEHGNVVMVHDGADVTSVPHALLPVVRQAVTLSQTSVASPEVLTVTLAKYSYDVAPIPLSGGIIVVAYDKAGEEDARTKLRCLAGLMSNRLRAAVIQDEADLRTALASKVTNSNPVLLSVQDRDTYLLPISSGHISPFITGDSIPHNGKLLPPSPTVLSGSHDVSQLFKTYLPDVHGRGKVCSSVSVAPIGNCGFLLSPDFTFEVTLNADLTTTPMNPVPYVASGLLTASEALLGPLERVREFEALKTAAQQSTRNAKLSKIAHKIIQSGVIEKSKEAVIDKFKLAACQDKIAEQARILEDQNSQLEELKVLKASQARLLWQMDAQSSIYALVASMKGGMAAERIVEEVQGCLGRLYDPKVVALIPKNQAAGHSSVQSLTSQALDYLSEPEHERCVLLVREVTAEGGYNSIVDGSGFESFLFAKLRVSEDGLIVRIGGGAGGFPGDFEESLIKVLFDASSKAVETHVMKTKTNLALSSLCAFSESFDRAFSDEKEAKVWKVQPTGDSAVEDFQQALEKLSTSSAAAVTELYQTRSLANSLASKLDKLEMAEERKRLMNLVVGSASAACSKCLASVGEAGAAGVLSSSASASVTDFDSASGGARGLIRMINEDTDILHTLRAKEGSVQLFITCKSWGGEGRDISLKPESTHPVFSWALEDQYSLPWGGSLAKVIPSEVTSELQGHLIGANMQLLISGEHPFLGIKDPMTTDFSGVVVWENEVKNEEEDQEFEKIEVDSETLADAKDLLNKTLAACIRRVHDHRKSNLTEARALEGERFKSNLVKTEGKLQEISKKKEEVEREAKIEQEKRGKVEIELEGTKRRMTLVETGNEELNKMKLKLASEAQQLAQRNAKLEAERSSLDKQIEDETRTSEELRKALVVKDSALLGFEKTVQGLGKVVAQSTSLERAVVGLKESLKLILSSSDVLVALLKGPASPSQVFELVQASYVGDPLTEEMILGVQTWVGGDDDKGEYESPKVWKLSSPLQPDSLLGIITLGEAPSTDMQKCLRAFLQVSASSVLRIHTDGDIDLLQHRAELGDKTEKMFSCLVKQWESSVREDPYNTLTFVPEHHDVLYVTVRNLEGAARTLMDGPEKDISVKVLLSGGSTTTGAPALTSVAGDVVPLVDENSLLAQVVETGEVRVCKS